MDECEAIYDFMVLKYVKKNKPTPDEFQKYVNIMIFGYENHANLIKSYLDKKMIFKPDDDNVILTELGKATLNNMQSKKHKENILIIAPMGALSITTFTLFYSIIFGF